MERRKVVNEANEEFDFEMKLVWVGIKGILGKRTEETDTRITTLRAQNGKIVSTKFEGDEGSTTTAVVEHFHRLGTSTTNEGFAA